MGVTSVKQIFRGRRYSKDDKAVRKYTLVFLAFTDSNYDDARSVIQGAQSAGVVPLIGSTYPSDTGATCRSVEASQADEPRVWDITAEYSSETTSEEQQDGTETPEEPTARPPKIRWGKSDSSKPAENIDGSPIRNSAGEPYDPIPEVDISHLTLTIIRNEENYDPLMARDYINSTNDDEWDILGVNFARSQARCIEFSAERQFEGQEAFYEVTYQFEFRTSWYLSLLDQGHYFNEGGAAVDDDETSGGTGEPQEVEDTLPRKIKNDDGDPIDDLVLLDGMGNRLPKGGEPVFRSFTVYPERDFSLLNLPTEEV